MNSDDHECNIPSVSVCVSAIFTTFWLLSKNFGSRDSGKPIKCSKDSDNTLDYKKT